MTPHAEGAPGAAQTFASLKLDPALLKGLTELGFVKPTPIQLDAIPPGLAGRDVLAATFGVDSLAEKDLPETEADLPKNARSN